MTTWDAGIRELARELADKAVVISAHSPRLHAIDDAFDEMLRAKLVPLLDAAMGVQANFMDVCGSIGSSVEEAQAAYDQAWHQLEASVDEVEKQLDPWRKP